MNGNLSLVLGVLSIALVLYLVAKGVISDYFHAKEQFVDRLVKKRGEHKGAYDGTSN